MTHCSKGDSHLPRAAFLRKRLITWACIIPESTHSDGTTQGSLYTKSQQIPSGVIQRLHGKRLRRERTRAVLTGKGSIRLGFIDIVPSRSLHQRVKLDTMSAYQPK